MAGGKYQAKVNYKTKNTLNLNISPGPSISSSRLHWVKALPSRHQCLRRTQLSAGKIWIEVKLNIYSLQWLVLTCPCVQVNVILLISPLALRIYSVVLSPSCGVISVAQVTLLCHTATGSYIAVSQVNDRFKLDWGTYLTTSKSFEQILPILYKMQSIHSIMVTVSVSKK